MAKKTGHAEIPLPEVKTPRPSTPGVTRLQAWPVPIVRDRPAKAPTAEDAPEPVEVEVVPPEVPAVVATTEDTA